VPVDSNLINGPGLAELLNKYFTFPACKRLKTSLNEFENDYQAPVIPVDELVTYMSLRVPPETPETKKNYLLVNEQVVPKLSLVAKSLLFVPASCSSSERVFIAAGITVSQRHTALHPNTGQHFVHSNI